MIHEIRELLIFRTRGERRKLRAFRDANFRASGGTIVSDTRDPPGGIARRGEGCGVTLRSAEKMLAADPKLKADFAAALAADPALAGNPRARLLWLYKRSPFYESDKDVYPILRAVE